MAKIKTGVDKLVELVQSRKKISLADASKELGVSKDVVREWSEFLDEEGLIGIEYFLSKTYLTEKNLSKKEIEAKAKQYAQQKEAFIRKVDTTLKQLEKETAGFEEIKSAYNSLKNDIGDQIDQVKNELDEMKHYESLKQSIDQDIIQQKVDYQKMVDDVHRKLYAEERRYEKLLREIKGEENHLTQQRESYSTLDEKESSLKKRLVALKEVVGGIDSQLKDSSKSISLEEDRLARLRELSVQIEKEIKNKRKEELEPLIKASKEHSEKILKVQDSILDKVRSRKGKVTTYEKEAKGIVEKFDKFFKKRMATENLLNSLERHKAEMEHELEGLKQKATAFNLLSKKSDVKRYVASLEKSFEEFNSKRGVFKRELQKLRDIIGS